jgi:hypothetical protein
MFIKFQIYCLSVSTACKEKDSYFKDVRSGTPVYSWVILNRRHVIFETKNLILKRNYQTQVINMSLKQETIWAKARLLFNTLKNKNSETSCENSLHVTPTVLEKDWVDKLSRPRFMDDFEVAQRATFSKQTAIVSEKSKKNYLNNY